MNEGMKVFAGLSLNNRAEMQVNSVTLMRGKETIKLNADEWKTIDETMRGKRCSINISYEGEYTPHEIFLSSHDGEDSEKKREIFAIMEAYNETNKEEQ